MADPSAFYLSVENHRRRLSRVIEKGGVTRLKKLYSQAQAELGTKLRKQVRAGLGDTFGAHQHRMLLAQLRLGQMQIAGSLAREMDLTSLRAREDALGGYVEDVLRLEKHYTGAEITLPIEQASVFARVTRKHDSSLMRVHRSSFARHGSHLVGKMEDQLALSLVQGETMGQTIDRITDIADNEEWQAERIVRTELSYATSVTQIDGAMANLEALPDLMMRWTEHVDDLTGLPLDGRVGGDSLALHGQVAPPGGEFEMPEDPRAPESMWGQTWTTTPSRPNGRECLVPWRASWGVPGWQVVDGERVDVGEGESEEEGEAGEE